MIAKALLTAENVGRGILIWMPQPLTTKPMEAKIKSWTADHEKIFAELEKDYGKGKHNGDVIQVDRDICSFRQADRGD